MKITIVEDDEAIRTMYSYKLQSAGYEVSVAKDGIEALSVIETIQPDLVLLDIKMPRLPGNEVLRRIRQQPWGKDMHVVVLTNISKSEAPQEFRFLNVAAYIVKVHYTPDQVVKIIKEISTKN
jgi:DNA-binding response OmpR family regulator